jgi:hypothetical protein
LTLVLCKDQHDIDERKALIKKCPHILFQIQPVLHDTFDSIQPSPNLFLGPWQRAGYPDFYINQP